MQKPITIAVLVGTTREHRLSIHAARFIAEQGRMSPDTEIVLVDPREFNFPNDGNKPEGKDPKYTAIVERADAFFIITPEYNHSFPGSLKRMLDSEYDAYFYKPVALAGASDGQWGGTRAVEALLAPLRTLRMVTCASTVYFPFVQRVFDDEGAIVPEEQEKYAKSVQGAYRELIWLAKTLRYGREQIAK